MGDLLALNAAMAQCGSVWGGADFLAVGLCLGTVPPVGDSQVAAAVAGGGASGLSSARGVAPGVTTGEGALGVEEWSLSSLPGFAGMLELGTRVKRHHSSAALSSTNAFSTTSPFWSCQTGFTRIDHLSGFHHLFSDVPLSSLANRWIESPLSVFCPDDDPPPVVGWPSGSAPLSCSEFLSVQGHKGWPWETNDPQGYLEPVRAP